MSDLHENIYLTNYDLKLSSLFKNILKNALSTHAYVASYPRWDVPEWKLCGFASGYQKSESVTLGLIDCRDQDSLNRSDALLVFLRLSLNAQQQASLLSHHRCELAQPP